MKEKNIALYGNLTFGVFIVIATVLYMLNIMSPYFIKSLDSILFVLCGFFNLILLYKFRKTSGIWKSFFMMLGLIFACIGDIVLIGNFVLGAIFFAIGHVWFLVYFYALQKFNYKDILIGGIIFLISLLLILFLPVFNFGDFLAIVIVYALIISMMLGKAFSNFLCKMNIQNLVVFIGAFLFFFSDLMLVFDNFSTLSGVFGYLCLSTYYPAEFLLAISIFIQTYSNDKKEEIKQF